MKKLLTAKQVAQLLSVNPATVYEWAQIGYIPHIVLSEGTRRRSVRFNEDAVERWLEAKKKPGRVERLPTPQADPSRRATQRR